MGTCSSKPKGVTWEERWFSPSCKSCLHKFCDHKLKSQQAVVTGTGRAPMGSERETAPRPKKNDEFENWSTSVRTTPAKLFSPKTVGEVQAILAQARQQNPMPKVRCVGSGHTWTPVFGDDGSWVLDTSGLNSLVWSADHPTEVTIGPGVTGGQLGTYMDSKDRGIHRGLFLASDVVLESVTYGGTIALGCHGTGKTKTLPDYVLKTSIIKWDGSQVDLVRADDPAGFALKVLSLGLLGVTVAYTLKLDDSTSAVRVTDSKVRARDLFLSKGELPKPGGSNPLREAWNGGYAIEIFYMPASSLKIKNLLSNEFEDQEWDPYNDICPVKTFQRTNNAVKKDNDSFFGIDPKTSTRFDRNFSIYDFLNSNVGTKLGNNLISRFGDKPALVALYMRTAAKEAFEPRGKEIGQLHYETSLAQAIHWIRYLTDSAPASDMEVCIKCDPDFASAYKAIHAAIGISKTFAEDKDTLPLNVAMEIRFTKHSDSPMSPAYGREGDVFMWIEVLSSIKTPRLKEYVTKVADAWLAVKLKDGSQAAYPHWAKWSEAYVTGADAKLKRAYAARLPYLRRAAGEFDPKGMFATNFFTKLLAP